MLTKVMPGLQCGCLEFSVDQLLGSISKVIIPQYSRHTMLFAQNNLRSVFTCFYIFPRCIVHLRLPLNVVHPSRGSEKHHSGSCQPCSFFLRGEEGQSVEFAPRRARPQDFRKYITRALLQLFRRIQMAVFLFGPI